MTEILITANVNPTAGLKNTNIVLNSTTYKGVSVNELTQGVEVSEQPLAEGQPLTDNIQPLLPGFTLDITFGDEWENSTVVNDRNVQYQKLKSLIDSGILFKFESDFGVFENMTVTNFTIRQSSGGNTFGVRLEIQQIQYAILALSTVQVIYDRATGDALGINATPVNTAQTEVTLSNPNPVSGVEAEEYGVLPGTGLCPRILMGEEAWEEQYGNGESL
jgi:hypothetical protein